MLTDAPGRSVARGTAGRRCCCLLRFCFCPPSAVLVTVFFFAATGGAATGCGDLGRTTTGCAAAAARTPCTALRNPPAASVAPLPVRREGAVSAGVSRAATDRALANPAEAVTVADDTGARTVLRAVAVALAAADETAVLVVAVSEDGISNVACGEGEGEPEPEALRVPRRVRTEPRGRTDAFAVGVSLSVSVAAALLRCNRKAAANDAI